MVYLLIVILFLSGIYFFSYKTNQLLLRLLFLTTHNIQLTTSILSLLLYPGVVIHELSHFITAVLLFVPVKSMTLVPKVTEDQHIQGGSVTIEKVDLVRRTLVGIAPLFMGITVLWLTTIYLLPPIPFVCNSMSSLQASEESAAIQNENGIASVSPSWRILRNDVLCNNDTKLITDNSPLTTILALYLLFSISSTMYSSKKDLDALFITVPFVIFLGIIAYILGFQFEWIVNLVGRFEGFFHFMTIILAIPFVILVVLFFLLKLFTAILHLK
ncbi:hypothetical protein HY469_01760 [Candidatus Roizmanbacteria bacterium]|nr:hypothetical protein [Candidatus Roizmanbacteria bacterium]